MRRKTCIYGVYWLQKGIRYVLQSWTIDCLKMYKISDEIIKCIEKTIENWRVELTAGRKAKLRWSPDRYLLGICAITITICDNDDATESHISEMHGRIQTNKLQEKINHSMYMDDIKLFTEWKIIRNPNTDSENILSGIQMEFGLEKCAMLMRSEKRHMTEGIERTNKKRLECTGERKPTKTWEY